MASALIAPFRSRRAPAPPGGDGNSSGEMPPQAEDFTHRAAVLVHLPVGREETTAREQWERCGLLFSRLGDAHPGDTMVLYRVEVRLQGSRWGALSEAERRVTAALAGRVTAQIGDSTLLEPEDPPTAVSTWYVHRKVDWGPGWWRSRAAQLWVQVGAADVHRRVRLDGPGTYEEAVAALRRRPDLGGVTFDEELHDVRPGIASAHALRPQDPAPWHTRALGLPGMAVGATAMLFGWVLAGLDLRSQVALAPLLLAAAWWVGPWFADRERHSRMITWLCGLAMVGSTAFSGFMIRMISTTLGDVGGWWPAGIVLCGLPVLRGCMYALRQSWFSRNAAAVLPIAVLPLAWVLPWMGRLAQGVYLTACLGIPLSAANVDPLSMYLAGVKPAALCIAAASCGLALLGWARHFYWITGSRAYCLAISGTLTALMMAAAVLLGLTSTTEAAHRTAAQAAAGHHPSSFFGISARLVCVSPLDAANTAVQPGPLPTGHPVVAFDVTGDETWLWDPQRAKGSADLAERALRMRTDQIATRPAGHGARACPPN
ncbi:hypothetical protein [Streptomyces buecherae]|uniref:Uncharacterized protein n=1 Tax=Streptomyces buecherae TaxID=2763006 RepID=A0A7H8NHU0_9ACTN|nr:hypothetical protein [Streptomyces buecherae]QKW48249.1 hypothetical protein HUT08_00355 [Streptomyces buecherae]QKW54081.1 hypothetical protein HUT08_36070 [Streptomyces buecherae]